MMKKQKKKRRYILPAALILLLGVGAVCYPLVSSGLNKKNQSRMVENYDAQTEKMTDAETQAVLASAQEFNAALWKENGTSFSMYGGSLSERYPDELSIADVMGYIHIPRIGVRLAILHGTDDETLQSACGHMEGSSLPVGGENTHAVLSGHRGLPSASLFTDLDQMREGDTFYLHILGDILAYQVDQITTCLPENTEELGIVEGGDYVTLLTCTPYGINTQRLLVRGTRVPYEPQSEEHVEKIGSFDGIAGKTWLMIVGAAVAGLLIVTIIPAVYRHRAKRRSRE